MPTPPTPYDITPLPFFAYEPGLQDWVIFVVTAGLILGAILFVARRKRRATIEAFSFALSELMRLRSEGLQTLSKDHIGRASLIVKRLASVLLGAPIAQLSPNELQRYADQSADPTLRSLLERVLSLDKYKYQPDTAPLPPSSELGQLISMIEKLEQEARQKK